MGEKNEGVADVVKKIQALDNEVKIKMLSLLVDQGSKSITDISKDLNINFSTAHKYLEQLEGANLVTSKQVSDNRLKRLFVVKDFSVDFSPAGLSNILKNKETIAAKKGKMHVIDENGEDVLFDEKLFAQKYLKRGLPRGTIQNALGFVMDQSYDGMTLMEMRELFKKALEKKVENIHAVFEQIEESNKHKRTHAHLLELVHPEALQQHMNGDIFIYNLRNPRLLNFVHDIRGLIRHGINKSPTTLQEVFEQTIYAVKKSLEFTNGAHAFDSFNFFIAPLVKPHENLSCLKTFFDSLSKFSSIFYINLDAGKPRFIKNFVSVIKNKSSSYENFIEEAERILNETLKILNSSNYKNIIPIIKVWDEKFFDKEIKNNTIYVNMLPKWQTENVSVIGSTRFDSSWRGVQRTSRIGEVQRITINLPRLALKSKKTFYEELERTIKNCVEYHLNMMELTIGEFLRYHQMHFKSEDGQRWPYLAINDCYYTIALTGIRDALEILGKSATANNIENILSFCNKILEGYPTNAIRLALKEDDNLTLARRFSYLDSASHNYAVGADCDPIIRAKTQKLFLGGHIIQLSKENFRKCLPELLKADFGAAHII